jgi:hypothetical protein
MGYCMSQRESTIWINKDNVRKALKAIKALKGQESIHDGSGAHFSWVRNDFHKINDFKEMMDEWGWEVVFDEEGNVTDLRFEREKIGDEVILFCAIAPFVDAGGYIEMQGEDGALWRWKFDGKTCVEVAAKVSWE